MARSGFAAAPRSAARRGAAFALLLLGSTFSGGPRVQEPPLPETPPADLPVPPVEVRELLGRVALVGASASAGFNLESELERRRTLADLLPELLRADDERRVLDASDELTFLDPLTRGARQIDRVVEFEPRAVFALDFLFWYAYGPVPEVARAPRFERGLEQLARLRVPVVVGDVPDMRGARSVMMPPEYVPTEATLAALNERLGRFAAERDDVSLVPLGEWIQRFKSDEPFELRGERWEAGDGRDLLQWDELHPSVEGSLLLLALGLDALDREVGGALAADVDWQVRRVAERVLDGEN